MKRLAGAALAAGGLAVLTAIPAGAGQPRIYHTITSSHGFALLDQTVGCERTEAYVSSSVAMYAGQPGPVNKQGLTGAFVRVTDVCATETVGPRPAAGGGGGAVIFEADGQNGARLVTDNRLRGASISTSVPGADANGDPVTIALSATWTPIGPLEHTTVRTHVNLGVGNVSSTANDLRRPVTARVSVSVGGFDASGEASEATLEQTKSRCVEIPRPGVEEFYPCFGFPG